MALKRQEERARGAPYDLVILVRWDILWRTPMLDVRFLPGWHPQPDRRRRTVWLPRICAPIKGGDAIGRPFRSGVCGGISSPWLATQANRECAPAARACDHDMSAEAREIYVMDWWLVLGTSADADEFAGGVSDRFAEHGAQVLKRLAVRPRNAISMGHAWFGAQLIWSMNMTLRHVGNIAVDFHLGRAWNEFDCLAMRPACKARVCSAHDMLPPAPWHTSVASWPAEEAPSNASLPPTSSLPNPDSQMASSCEDRYFLCKKGSRRCRETEQMLEIADHASRRALFLGCADSLCPADQLNSTVCGGKLLLLWLNISGALNLVDGPRGCTASSARTRCRRAAT